MDAGSPLVAVLAGVLGAILGLAADRFAVRWPEHDPDDAEHLGATHIIDTATLTGAVGRALGNLVTGAFGQPQGFYDEVMAAADLAGERYWQLPLIEDYVPEMDSWYGDLQNSGTAEGSLVRSGLFLREFVTKPWVHLDIAGTAYLRKPTAWAPRGATGVSHATLVELALAGARPS